MALDPRILLQNTTPDLMSAIQGGIRAGQAIRRGPLEDALMRARSAQGVDSIQQAVAIPGVGFQTLSRGGAVDIKSLTPEQQETFRIASEEQARRQAEAAGLKSGATVRGKLDVEGELRPGVEASVVTAKGQAETPIKSAQEVEKLRVQRESLLREGVRQRRRAANTASQFLEELKSGRASSGAGRSAAQFVPGVFTTQGEFDEKFNAFAEIAARQKLKASGETRPTDADVEGMKRAMFGVGRDEAVNIALLQEFIDEQGDLDAEMLELQGVTPNEGAGEADAAVIIRHPSLGDITEGDIRKTMQDNNMTREQVLERLQGG
jgi:hypothetical protein